MSFSKNVYQMSTKKTPEFPFFQGLPAPSVLYVYQMYHWNL